MSKSVYSDFLNEKQNKSKNYKINLENDKIYTPNKLTMYFLECAACCNNIYKIEIMKYPEIFYSKKYSKF